MATEIELPVVDETVDPTDPAGSLQTLVFLILGAAILVASLLGASEVGQEIYDRATEALGVETQESSAKVSF